MKLKIAAIATAVAAASTFSGAAMAYDLRIEVNGQVSANTCQIDGGTGQITKRIDLPTINTNSLKEVGSYAGRTPLTVSLTNCDAATSAVVHFEADTTNVTPAGTLKNLAVTDAATGVEVQLMDDKAKVLNLNTDSPSYSLSGGAGTMTFYAQYHAPVGNVQAGAVSSYIEMSMNYN